MGIYQSIRDFGKKTLLVGGLVGLMGFVGCMTQRDMEIKVASADFNGDGKQDIATAVYTFNSSWDINCSTNGGESFSKIFHVPHMRLTEFKAEDIDNDGKVDLIYKSYNNVDATGWHLYLMRGNGDGTFQNPKKLG